MNNAVEVIQTFDGLGAIAKRLNAADKDGIVSLGSALENAISLLEGDTAAQGAIGQMLTILQGAYQDQLCDSGGALQRLAAVIAAIENSLKLSGLIGADTLKSAIAELDAVLNAAPMAQADPNQNQNQNIPASEPGDPDLSRLEADINNASALLAVLTPQDAADLKGVLEKIAAFASSPVLPEAIGHLAREVVSHLEVVVSGNSEGDLAAAVQLVGHICLQLQDISCGCASLKAEKAQQIKVQAKAESPTVPSTKEAESKPEPIPAAQISEAGTAPPAVAAQILPLDADMDLLKEYVTEALDHITAAETSLLALESDPSDVEQINTVFRAFHTIKGASGFLSLEHIQKLSHRAENLLDRARTGQLQITGGYADLALKSCDLLRSMIGTVKVAQAGQELPLPEQFAEWMENLANPEAHGFSADSDASSPLRLGDILVARNEANRQQVEEAVAKQGDRPLGQTLVAEGMVPAASVAVALRTQKQITSASTAESSVRVSTERMDQLINMVGELVIAQSMIAQDPSIMDARGERLARNVSHAGKIVRELQDLTMGLRMVPLRATFQKMARLVRDLSRKSGKSVQFITEGDDTEIDRGMVEVLNDPLVHMMRNAVDHGVESPEARLKDGKTNTGTIRLRAYHSAGNVVIELSDDGHGLNSEKILSKARERGLVDSSRELSESEIFGLIFLPGFSTADKVTDVSGRGVGMDVVKRGIESLRGRIDIASQVGVGSTFAIRLPLTMAIADAMLLRVGQQRFLIPTISIEHSFRPTTGSISTIKGQGEMVMLRGRLIPMFRLYSLFGVAGAITNPLQSILIVIEGQSQRCAIMVDELLGQQQVVIKSLGQALGAVKGVSGGAILGDGRVGLVLDPSGILQLAHTGSHVGGGKEAA